MNRHLLLTALLLCACAAALRAQPSAPSYPQTMYVIYDGAPLYDSAHHTAPLLGELPLGDTVRVLGVAGKFYRVRQGEREGFIYWSNIAPEKPKEVKRKKARKKTGTPESTRPEPTGSTRSDDAKATTATPDSAAAVSSGKKEDRKPRAGKSNGARCRGTTKSGRQCSRTATDPSGYCWQHRK